MPLPELIRKASTVALVVGSILLLINQYSALFGDASAVTGLDCSFSGYQQC